MSASDLTYKIKTATQEEIFTHLMACNNYFNPPLDQKVDIHSYSIKINEMAITFEAWSGPVLTGLVAAYFNDKNRQTGFITNVSTLSDFKRKGISKNLLKQCIGYAADQGFSEIDLEVSGDNIPALRLYRDLNFTKVENKDGMNRMKLLLEQNIQSK